MCVIIFTHINVMDIMARARDRECAARTAGGGRRMDVMRTRKRHRLLGTVAAASGALAAGTLAVVAAGPAQAAVCETVEYTVVSDWGTGHQANVSLTAGTEAVDGWTLEFDLPSGAAVQSAWNVDWS